MMSWRHKIYLRVLFRVYAYRGWMARAWTLASAGPCKLGSIPAQDIRGALGCAREALHRARYRVQL